MFIGGSQNCNKKNELYLKIISTRVCKKFFFLIKAKNKFVLGVPKFKNKTFIFEYFPKIPSEMKSTHPFYTILIPMTCKHFHFVRRGALRGPRTLKKNLWYLQIISIRGCKKIFFIRAKKNSVLGVPKFRTKAFIFEYFPKIPSEMISTHPFYTILIPMTSHAKILFCS